MRYLTCAAVLLAGTCLTAMGKADQSVSLPICVGGPFEGSVNPTYPPTPDDPRNCRALPTRTTSVTSAASVPRPDTISTLSAGDHFNGSETIQTNFTSIEGRLQVQNTDLSQSGDSFVSNIYSFQAGGDFTKYLSTGWIEESFDDRRVVIVEHQFSRFYYDQYPLTDGGQYWFAVVSKPTGAYTLFWWNNTWQQISNFPAFSPVEGLVQQFLRIYTSNGVHPHVEPTFNDNTRIVRQGSLYVWDTSFQTETRWFEHAPYTVNWIQMFHNWAPGCWGGC